MQSLAPIALFVYRRPRETQQTLERLSQNYGIENSELFVYCDAPRSESDVTAVKATRDIVKSRVWCPRTTLIERETNLGLAKSVILGVSELCERYGRVIVFEDDLLSARGTLQYFNTALNEFQGDDQVMQISGHAYNVKGIKADGSSFFLPFSASWGWATWARAWKHFDPNATGWERLLDDNALRHKFDADGNYFYTQMLVDQMRGKSDSWLLRWRWSVFLKDGLTLFPTNSLVRNIGFGPTATHTRRWLRWAASDNWNANNQISHFPKNAQVDQEKWEAYKRHFGRFYKPSILTRARLKAEGILHRLFFE